MAGDLANKLMSFSSEMEGEAGDTGETGESDLDVGPPRKLAPTVVATVDVVTETPGPEGGGTFRQLDCVTEATASHAGRGGPWEVGGVTQEVTGTEIVLEFEVEIGMAETAVTPPIEEVGVSTREEEVIDKMGVGVAEAAVTPPTEEVGVSTREEEVIDKEMGVVNDGEETTLDNEEVRGCKLDVIGVELDVSELTEEVGGVKVDVVTKGEVPVLEVGGVKLEVVEEASAANDMGGARVVIGTGSEVTVEMGTILRTGRDLTVEEMGEEVATTPCVDLYEEVGTLGGVATSELRLAGKEECPDAPAR